MNDLAKNLLTWAIIAIVLVSIFNHYASVGTVPDSLSYSEFLNNVKNGQVAQVHIQSNDCRQQHHRQWCRRQRIQDLRPARSQAGR